jgi:hypothetical protein
MTRTDRTQVWDQAGNLISDVPVVISDERIFREDAPTRLVQGYLTLRQWADDAETTYADWPTKTAAQKDAINREVIRRLGVLADGIADLILHRGLV